MNSGSQSSIVFYEYPIPCNEAEENVMKNWQVDRKVSMIESGQNLHIILF